MELKEFLQSKFEKSNFIEFISDRFYGFSQNLIEDKYLGKVKLDDKSEVGFFIFKEDENRDIENSRVGFHKELKEYADKYLLDGALGAFYNLTCNAWRLSFIRFSYDDNNKKVFTNQKRFTFVLGNSKTKTAYEQLKNVKYPKLLELEQAFGVEAITKEFYKGLVKEYEKLLNQYLTYPNIYQNNNKYENSKKEFAIRLVGRILFIKFLNKKSLVPDSIFKVSNSYYHEKLEPLFFEQLNTPKSERKKEFSNDSIPFLNGGLFEPLKDLDCYEWNGVCSSYINTLKVDDRFFTELYEHLNQYNFTIDENSIEDSELSIDPEMLGRIFENLLAEINPETSQNARKSTGSYYTPREIVEYMVSSSLLEYLKTKTSIEEETLQTIIFKNEEPQNDYDKAKVLSAIFELKILDPACGSGAFPMGLLQKIVKILNLIDEDATIWFGLQCKEFKEAHKNRNKDYIRKLSIIKNTIYGIDIQPIAIEISKLRFFLSLIVDEEGEPEPLPNLEFKFVCANSLLPKPKNTQLASLEYYSLESKLLELKNEYFEASGNRKEEIKKEYRQTQKEMFDEEEATNLLSALENKLTSYDPFDPVSVAPFFDSDFMFNIKDGFDIVIGNPPYIDSEAMSKEQSSIRDEINFNQQYTLTKGNWDIYIAFFDRAFNLLNKKYGLLNYITPDKWLTKPFGKEIRKNKNEAIVYIVQCGRKVFETANVDSIITMYSSKQNSTLEIYEYIDKNIVFKNSIDKKIISNDFRYDMYFSNNLKILFEIEKIKNKLSDLAVCENACATSDAYKLKEFILSGLEIDDQNENYLKVINTGTIDKYVSKWKNKEMTYLKDKYLYPVVKKEVFIKEFMNSYAAKSLSKKIIVKGLTLLDGCLDDEGDVIPGKSTLIILQDDLHILKFLLAIINSRLMNFYINEKYSSSSYNGGVNFTKDMINDFPVPVCGKDIIKTFEMIVDYVIFLKELPNEQKIDEYVSNEHIAKQFEEVIDGMVFELYFTDEFKAKNIEFIKYAKEDFIGIENLDDISKQKVIKEAYLKLSETKNPIRNNLLLLPVEFDFIKTILWS